MLSSAKDSPGNLKMIFNERNVFRFQITSPFNKKHFLNFDETTKLIVE